MEDKEIQELIRKSGKHEKAVTFNRFFRTGKGEYGEGDMFLGITTPVMRELANKLKDITDEQIEELMNSPYHEERSIALVILNHNYEKAKKAKDNKACKKIYEFYLKHTKRINNWDLVDISCHHIVGDYLLDKDRKILETLAKSKLIWERRIAIVSTYAFMQNRENKDTFKIADILLHDKHDLIHKAVGWMLRESGKRVSEKELKEFLKTRYMKMPRTMLRYSIEKFEEKERRRYIEGLI